MSRPTITPDSCLAVNPDLVLREEDAQTALLFHPDTGEVRVLNGTALALWRLIDGERPVCAILAALAERYEGFDAAAEEQVLRVLTYLAAAGSLHCAESS